MGDPSDQEYETDERGERAPVRSVEASHAVFLRFSNKVASRPVDVWWRDYAGRRRRYARLPPAARYDVNTFATHPWEFTDARTGERYVINNQRVYRAPRSMSSQYRTNWNITIGVRTLRHSALLALAAMLKQPSHARDLELPRSLALELQDLAALLSTKEEPPPTD